MKLLNKLAIRMGCLMDLQLEWVADEVMYKVMAHKFFMEKAYFELLGKHHLPNPKSELYISSSLNQLPMMPASALFGGVVVIVVTR